MKLLNKIINELYDNIEFFSIELPINLEGYKKFTELTVFVEFVSKVSDKIINPNIDAIAKFISTELEKLDSDTIFNNKYLPYHLIFPYFSIREKHPNIRFEKYLEITSKYKYFPPEIPPHRELEWSHFCLKLNKINKVKTEKNCIINQNNFLTNFNRDLAYSFTHSLFYIYDFGFANSKPSISNYNSIKFQTECLIFKSYDESDIDIILELFINYFGFYRYNDINIELIDVLENLLIKNNFLNFNWKANNNIEKIYHSNLVLGILCCLLIDISDSKNVSLRKKEKLKTKMENSLLFNSHFDSNKKHGIENSNLLKFKENNTWQLIMKSTKKEFKIDDIIEYEKNYKLNINLIGQILNNVNLFKNRNDLNLLFESEFTHLNVSEINQEKLKNEYSILLDQILDKLSDYN